VKYWAPLSKRPKAVSTLAMRPPGASLRSNSVTLWPACTSVRAQATPAMPAPMTAKWRGWAGCLGCLGAGGVRWRSAAALAGFLAVARVLM